MQFIFNRHLLTCSLFCLILSTACIQAARIPNSEKNATIHFWFKKNGNNGIRFLEGYEYQQLSEKINEGSPTDEYEKKTYQAVAGRETCIWSTVMELIKDLNIKYENSWLDLDLILKGASIQSESETSPINGDKSVCLLSKFAEVVSQMNIIIAKKQGKKSQKIKIVVDEGDMKPLQEELQVYPTTTLGDLMCYLVYYSSLPESIKNKLSCNLQPASHHKNYTLTTQKNKELALEHALLKKTIKEMKSDQFTWARKQCLCKFFLNKDGSLISLKKIGDIFDIPADRSEEIKKGLEKDWKCTEKSIGKGKLLFPIIASLCPDISTMDIMYSTLSLPEHNNTYELHPHPFCYDSGTINQAQNVVMSMVKPITVSTLQIHKPYIFVLSSYKAKKRTTMQCILKQEGKPEEVILQEVVPINQPEKNSPIDTYFVEAYLYLMHKAGYLIDEVSCEPGKITYTTHNSETEKVLSKNIYNSMADHQREFDATTYTFVMPKSARLMSQEEKLALQFNQNQPDKNIIKYIVMAFIVAIAIGAAGYLFWRVKKREKKIDSSEE